MDSARIGGRWLIAVLFAGPGFVTAAHVSAGLASFTGLGDFSGGRFESEAFAISPDGTVVVGYGYNQFGNREAFRWTSETGLVGLGDLPGGETFSDAAAASAYGKVVVGDSLTEDGALAEGFVWSAESGMIGLADLGDGKLPMGWGKVWSRALDVSWDGQVVVGVANGENGFEAFRWTAEDGMVGLGDLEGGFFESGANAVSADGLTVVGLGTVVHTEAVRWTEGDGIEGLGLLYPDDESSIGTGISADGEAVIGVGFRDGTRYEAFRWVEGVGMTGLGDLPGGVFQSEPYGISADGSVIVGAGATELGTEAFVWDPIHGMRNLREVLISEYGLRQALEGWMLETANGISADGTRIVGHGVNPRGQPEAFLVVLPSNEAPSTARLSNLSTRHRVGRGADVLVAGFVVGGAGEIRILVRGVGPGLEQFGVADPLNDPVLELRDATHGLLAASNDWDAAISDEMAMAGAFPLVRGSRDAVILTTVPAGRAYTVLLKGNDGEVGEGVIEVYAIEN